MMWRCWPRRANDHRFGLGSYPRPRPHRGHRHLRHAVVWTCVWFGAAGAGAGIGYGSAYWPSLTSSGTGTIANGITPAVSGYAAPNTQPVPEPSTLALLGVALILLGLRGRGAGLAAVAPAGAPASDND